MQADTFDTLIDAIEQGETLKKSIKAAGTSWRALSLLLERDQAAASRYARARATSGQFYADKAQEAVESAATGEEATIARARADVYKWRAAMADPKGYGDRKQVEVSGNIGHLHLAALAPHASISATAKLTELPKPGDADADA